MIIFKKGIHLAINFYASIFNNFNMFINIYGVFTTFCLFFIKIPLFLILKLPFSIFHYFFSKKTRTYKIIFNIPGKNKKENAYFMLGWYTRTKYKERPIISRFNFITYNKNDEGFNGIWGEKIVASFFGLKFFFLPSLALYKVDKKELTLSIDFNMYYNFSIPQVILSDITVHFYEDKPYINFAIMYITPLDRMLSEYLVKIVFDEYNKSLLEYNSPQYANRTKSIMNDGRQWIETTGYLEDSILNKKSQPA
ncbi:hypothetical protein N9Y92_04395 [Chlamydiales bacterium]|nr:hypothetical protein [Chlamydiales bacterium]